LYKKFLQLTTKIKKLDINLFLEKIKLIEKKEVKYRGRKKDGKNSKISK
jgi:hypothetical protein